MAAIRHTSGDCAQLEARPASAIHGLTVEGAAGARDELYEKWGFARDPLSAPTSSPGARSPSCSVGSPTG